MVKQCYTGYIYKIVNLCNNKVYIGLTRVDVNSRYQQHLNNSKSTKQKYNTKLYNAIRKYGYKNFKVEVLKTISFKYKKVLQKNLDKLERFYILKFNSDLDKFGYNMTRGGLFKRPVSNLKDEVDLQKQINVIYNRGSWNLNLIDVYDDYAEVILYDKYNKENGRVKIDIEDIPKVMNYKWYLYKCTRGKYARTNAQVSKMHNLILPHQNNFIIIHLNKNGLDNRKLNLKLVTLLLKQQKNKIPKNNKSGTKGVWWCKERNKWQAQITLHNKTKSLGRFDKIEDAIAARKAAEKIYYLI